jgi:two-component system chemotaxis response regulator CheY
MHTVEIADCHHRALQRPDIGRVRAVARDIESFCRRTGLVHAAAGRTMVFAENLFVPSNLEDMPTVSAPLTNFQINGLFKRHSEVLISMGGARLRARCVMAVDLTMPVLIVDDYSTMVRIIRNLLKQLGFRDIDDASDGSQALAKMRERKYGLVISDWNMEPMTGCDLLKEARQGPELTTTPFIMVTAESKTENVIAAKRAGVSSFIVKPFNAQTLKSKIDAVFQDATAPAA